MPKKSYDGAMRAVRIIEAQRKMSNSEQRTHSRSNVVQQLQQLIQERDGLEQLQMEIMKQIDAGSGPVAGQPEVDSNEYWNQQFRWNVGRGEASDLNVIKPNEFDAIREFRKSINKEQFLQDSSLSDETKEYLQRQLASVGDGKISCLVNAYCKTGDNNNRCVKQRTADINVGLEDEDGCMCNFLEPARCFNPQASYRQRAGADPYKGNAEYRQVTAQLDAVKKRVKEMLGMYRMFK